MTVNSTAESGNILKCEIFSNRESGKSRDISAGIVDFDYYESILDNTVRFSIVVVDTGNSENGSSSVSVLYDLKLSGFERVELIFEDNYENKLTFSGDNAMYIYQIKNIISNSEVVIFTIDLVSKEHLANEFLKTEVYGRFDGEISGSIQNILTEALKTNKTLIADTTSNSYNFCGDGKKPFRVCTEVATKGVPQAANSSAGYFFFETYDGYNFRSVDGLFNQPLSKAFIYNSSTKIPEGYDAKILSYQALQTINVKKNLESGAYGGRLETFDPYTHIFNPKTQEVNSEEQEAKGGEEFPQISPDFSIFGDISRRFHYRKDTGQMGSGNLSTQNQKKGDQNLELERVAIQSPMTYNKLFTLSITIVVPGNLSLRAGDLVMCDFPEQSAKRVTQIDKELSGIYIISDICYHLTPKTSLTKMKLVRDSFGRKTA